MIPMLVAKEFTFAAAHYLPNYHGKCENLHGHTYKLIVTVENGIQADGLALDFAEIEKVVNKKILSKLDHSNLNETIKNPSAENITLWIWKNLASKLPLKKLRLYESSTSYVEYEGKE